MNNMLSPQWNGSRALLSIMPRVKPSSYNLRKETSFKPKINTMRFKNSFINRLVFKYELAM